MLKFNFQTAMPITSGMNSITDMTFYSTSDSPAILGGKPFSIQTLPFVRPLLPTVHDLSDRYDEILSNGMVTTGPYAERLGASIAQYLNVEGAVAVSSCTCGLVLAFQALNLPKGSEVILPSFTFMASGLGPEWNGLRPRFVDVDTETMNIDPWQVEAAITSDTSAIVAVHQFGNPAPIQELTEIANKYGLALVFDAAHGFGSLYHNKPLGQYGRFEVFSMSPTKLLIAGEGGIVTSRHAAIIEQVRYARNYGNPGNYDCLYPGLNARMSELHAILALKSLESLEAAAVRRNQAAELYRSLLSEVPGISFQRIQNECRSSYKDFSIVVDERSFGLSRDQLIKAYLAEGIQSRVYYSPVLHKMTAFQKYARKDSDETLRNTLYLERTALSLPMYSNMTDLEVETVCLATKRIHLNARDIRIRLSLDF